MDRDAAAAIFIADDRAASGFQLISELVLCEAEQLAGLTKLSRSHGDQWSHVATRLSSAQDRGGLKSKIVEVIRKRCSGVTLKGLDPLPCLSRGCADGERNLVNYLGDFLGPTKPIPVNIG